MSAGRLPADPAGLLGRWRALVVPDEDPEAAAARRTRLVGEVAACIRRSAQRQRGRRTWRRAMAGLALAAAVCLGVGLWRVAEAPPGSASPGSTDLAAAPARLVAEQGTVIATVAGHATLVGPSPVGLAGGDEASTAEDGEAALELRGRARVKLHGATRLRVLRTELGGQRLALRSGKLHVSVPHQGSGQKLAIETPDAEVRVVGTEFTVEWQRAAADGQSATVVNVERGKVWVIQRGGANTVLAAGQRWSSEQRLRRAAEQVSELSAPTEQPKRHAGRSAAARHSSVQPSPEPTLPESELAAQNAMYRAALGARNAGKDARALALLERFLARYPNSPLQQEAQVERFRVLKRMGRYGDAAREARRYLAEHDSGFARDEARELALEPSPEPD
jgi:hypothetical protein